MTGPASPSFTRSFTGLLATLGLSAVMAGCTGTQIVGGAPTEPGFPDDTAEDFPSDYPEDTPGDIPSGGSWTGKITLKASINVDESTHGDNGQNPNSTYYATYTRDRSNHLDVTDTFTVSGEVGEGSMALAGFQFSGPAQNTGSADVSDVYVWDKQNSGCTWTEEDGHTMSGSWNGSGQLEGGLDLREDGSYSVALDLRPNDRPTLPMRDWQKNSDISANCEEVEPGYDTNGEGGPLFAWVTDEYGRPTTDGRFVVIEGTASPTAPLIEGTDSWQIGNAFPDVAPDLEVDPIDVTATWRFERSASTP